MISAPDISRALAQLGVMRGDTLLVHSGLKGALRLAGDTREEKLATLTAGLCDSVPDGLLILPTFTYSFTRGEDFHLRDSPSTVGILSERFRALPGVRRTTDPIFSCALLGELADPWGECLLRIGDHDCFGPHSIFGLLAHADAKLLFLGVGFQMCTFVHHVEQRLRVPYRHLKDFHGTVLDGDERAAAVTARYFVRDLADDVESHFAPLGEDLLAAGDARRACLERGPGLYVTSAAAVASRIERRLGEHPDYLLRRGHRAPATP